MLRIKEYVYRIRLPSQKHRVIRVVCLHSLHRCFARLEKETHGRGPYIQTWYFLRRTEQTIAEAPHLTAALTLLIKIDIYTCLLELPGPPYRAPKTAHSTRNCDFLRSTPQCNSQPEQSLLISQEWFILTVSAGSPEKNPIMFCVTYLRCSMPQVFSVKVLIITKL